MQQSQENSQELSVFNLTIEGFWQLHTYGIDLNHLFILECLNEGTDIEKHVKSTKLKAWKHNLFRKSMITEKGEVTVIGKEILKSLAESRSITQSISSVSKSADDSFEKWWKTYPGTDIFEYKGKKFAGSRALRVNKNECRKKFEAIIIEGEFNAEKLVQLLETEVWLKKEQSLKENDNKLRYMQNSLSYLNQRTFESFETISSQRPTDSNQSSSTVDI